MRKIREALRLRYEHGASQHEIGRSVGIVQSTAGEILRRSEAAGLVWPLPESLSDEDLDRLLYPPSLSSDEPPRPLPDWKTVDRELARKGVTLVLLWFEYRAEHPDGYGYSRFAELYRAWKGRTDLRMLQRHKAGEKVFVDFAGLTMPVKDPATGLSREVPIFVSAMGASQRISSSSMTGCSLRSAISNAGTYSKSSTIATRRGPPSSAPNCRSNTGTTPSGTRPWPTPSSTVSSTTLTDSNSKAAPCAKRGG